MSSRSQGDEEGPPPPSLPARYLAPRLVAVGGMGSVWRAQDGALGRNVAIKLLAECFSGDAGAVRRFMREARAAAHLSGHSHVVTIYDVGECEERPYIVMEYLAGGSVADALRLGAYSRAEALRWIEQAAAALDFAHARGVVHRDVKPANMLLSGDRVLHLADFGIASLGNEQTLSGGELFGTAAYLAPEQAHGRPTTAASDRYALAVAAFELLTGERPFTGEHFIDQARAHIEDPPPSASARATDLPPAVDAVLARGMAKDPAERWPSAASFATAVSGAVSGAVGAPAVEPAPRRARATGGLRTITRVLGEAELAGAASDAGAAAESPPLAGSAAGSLARSLAGSGPARRHRGGGPHWPGPRHRPAPSGEPPLVIFDSVARRGTARRLRGPAGIAAVLATAALAGGIVVGAATRGSPARPSADRVTGAVHGGHARSDAAAARPRAPSHRRPEASSTTTIADVSAQAAPALEARGHALMEAGDYAEALPLLREAVAVAPKTTLTYAYALYDLGRTLQLAGRPSQAIPILEARLKIPNQPAVVEQELAVAEAAAAHHSGTTSTDATTGTTTGTPPPSTSPAPAAGGAGAGTGGAAEPSTGGDATHRNGPTGGAGLTGAPRSSAGRRRRQSWGQAQFS